MTLDAGWAWWGCMVAVSLLNVSLLVKFARAPPAGRGPRVGGGRGTTVVGGYGAVGGGGITAARYPHHHYSRSRSGIVLVAPLPASVRWCAVVFTCACAYRAVLPRIDVPRICFFDTPASWPLLGRIAATFAELAWTFQFYTVLRAIHGERVLSMSSAARRTVRAGQAALALALAAECLSWTNLISGSDLFATLEQGVWSVLFFVLAAAYVVALRAWAAHPKSYRVLALLLVVMGCEQAWESLGLYLPRYLDEVAAGTPLEPAGAGLARLASCANVTQDMSAWEDDAFWMSGYFSFAVWSSLWLARAPLPSRAGREVMEDRLRDDFDVASLLDA
jgi:hypothetical protein